MQSVAEHSLFKAALPLVCAALVGSITWLFVTVMDIDKLVHKIEDSEIPQINKDLADGYKKVTRRRLVVVVLGSSDRFGAARSLLLRGWQKFEVWNQSGRQISNRDELLSMSKE